MPSCKCQLCKTKLNTLEAYKRVEGDKNLYYCNEQEYLQYRRKEQDELELYSELADIMGYDCLTKAYVKKVSEIPEETNVILATVKLQRKNIINTISKKHFDNDFFKFLYVMAIIKNNIQQTKRNMRVLKKRNDYNIEFDLLEIEHHPRKPAKDISRFVKGGPNGN